MKRVLRLKAVQTESQEKRLPLAIDANSKFVYASGSDVMKLWKKYGFVPPSEYRNDYLFKQNREKSDE